MTDSTPWFTDEYILLEERMIKRNWSWIENRWIVLKGKQRREFRVSHRIYSAVELSTLLGECGFGGIEVYGDLTGVEYDQNERRLVMIGRKQQPEINREKQRSL